jgi:hypothetical protein
VDQTLSWLQHTMVEITTKCKTRVNLQLYDHATSLTKQVALDISTICLTRANESMHSIMAFNWMEHKLRNLYELVGWLKGWHETMLQHENSRNRRVISRGLYGTCMEN